MAGVPEAKPLYLWAAVHWGLWGDVFGRLAAARQGVGDKVKRYSEILIALDERYEDAAGHRILGRLHTLAPKVPFVTGWVDRDKAVSELRRAVALGPDNLDNHLFLAEALFEYQPEQGGRGARDPAPPARPPARPRAGGRAGEEPRRRAGPARQAPGQALSSRPRPARLPLVAVAAAAFLVVLKGAGAWITGSLALGSAALDSAVDLFVSGANFLVLRRSARPPDEDHAYGHGKFENLAALGQGLFLVGAAGGLVWTGRAAADRGGKAGGDRLGHRRARGLAGGQLRRGPHPGRAAERSGSPALKADSLHYATDLWVNGAALLALVVVRFTGWAAADPLVALVVAGLRLQERRLAGPGGGRRPLRPRPARGGSAPHRVGGRRLRPRVLGMHDLKTRRSGGQRFIEFHLEIPAPPPSRMPTT